MGDGVDGEFPSQMISDSVYLTVYTSICTHVFCVIGIIVCLHPYYLLERHVVVLSSA